MNEVKKDWGFAERNKGGALAVHFLFNQQHESCSYPYFVITKWHWKKEGEQEILKIQAGTDTVEVTGKGLDHLVLFLNEARLAQVIEGASGVDKISVESIKIHSEV